MSGTFYFKIPVIYTVITKGPSHAQCANKPEGRGFDSRLWNCNFLL